jgi:hypothetical protein
MNRFAAIIAATAAAAAVAAAISLPAGADENTPSPDTQFVACLRSHGAAIPADTQGAAIKTWLVAHPDAESALKACAPDERQGAPAPEQLTSCLRDHGLQPPSNIDELKPWLGSQSETDAGKAAMTACGIDTRPGQGSGAGAVDVAKFATCLRDNGAAVPDGADGLALKTWLHDHEGEAKVANALRACDAGFGDGKKTTECGGSTAPGPMPGAAKAPDTAKAPDAAKTPDSVTLQQ